MKIKGLTILAVLLSMTITVAGCNRSDNDNYYNAGFTKYTVKDYGDHSAYSIDYFTSTSTKTQNLLVIPVVIKGYEENATEENLIRIQEAYFGDETTTGWESVASYYEKSSFGKLKISGEVTPWFELGMTPQQIYAKNNDTYPDYGTMYVLEQAYLWAANEQGIDVFKYDNDGDGFVEGIALVYSAPDFRYWGSQQSLGESLGYWAFTYWDYNCVYGDTYFYDEETGEICPSPHGYCWMSYDFMDDGVDVGIDIDAHTYIHEFGHLLGLDDYYDDDGEHAPMGYVDMMDANIGDHNSYTKYSLGWVEPYVVTGDATITIGPAEKTGDCIILKNNASRYFYDNAFSEYLILELITPTGLWEQDAEHTYYTGSEGVGLGAYSSPGIRVLHVDARLAPHHSNSPLSNPYGYIGKDLVRYCNNTPSRAVYKTENKNIHPDEVSLISKSNPEYFQTTTEWWASPACLFQKGDTFNIRDYTSIFPKRKMHDGTTIDYTFTIDSLNSESATITFKKGS